MKRNFAICVAAVLVMGLIAATVQAGAVFPDMCRFFLSGDGWISLTSEKSGESFAGQYRQGRAGYDQTALEGIHRVFGAPYDPAFSRLSLRLIEFLDFLEDRLCHGARITITSGYRNPDYNAKLRKQGILAAKASLHQYGMAADLKMDGVPARRIWDYVKGLGFGGTGFYHGETVHVDVGPARSWDEKTSGVGTGISSANKLIGLVTDYDVYLPGEMMSLRFIRMTAFPIGVGQEFALDLQTGTGGSDEVIRFKPSFSVSTESTCPEFNDMSEMASIHWHLPKELPPGRYKVRARFCNCPWEDMPPEISTPEFEIGKPVELYQQEPDL
jgi:uncharacterized protein YcbK (DUF882 family)